MTDEEYIKKWLDGTLSKEERKVFETTEDFQSLQELSRAIQAFQAPKYDVEAELQRLQISKARESKEGRVVHMGWTKTLLRIAAALVLMIGGYLLFFHQPVTVMETLAGEKSEFFLPDSSEVTLNAYSRLAYQKRSWKRKREVELDGEAFFKVAKGARFDVNTSAGIISVLGTQFNVKNRQDYFEVICYEGLVQVQRDEEVRKLPANQRFSILNGVMISSAVQAPSPRWLGNVSAFQSVPVIQVIRELERQYDVNVAVSNLDPGQLFTGSFIHSDLELALKSITIPLHLKYHINGEQSVVLSGGGQ